MSLYFCSRSYVMRYLVARQWRLTGFIIYRMVKGMTDTKSGPQTDPQKEPSTGPHIEPNIEPHIERREGHFVGHEGLELFYQSWSAGADKAIGTLVLTHGIGEHSESYNRTAEKLAPLGWDIFAWDLRGHGRSEGKRGYVPDFHFHSLDLGCFLRFLQAQGRIETSSQKPFALIAHSMGGLITLRHLFDEEVETPAPRALVLSSPLLGVALAVPKLKDAAARILNHVLPSVTLYNEIKYEYLTRDTEVLKSYETDPLRHEKISPSVYLGMFENIDIVMKDAKKLTLPTLIQAAGTEKIVSLPATRAFFASIGAENKKLIVYDERYHEIYNDLDRNQVFIDLNNFLVAVMK
jgi:alpha-beta hydrolase superfamily lysophospholipase